jgi:hypothetical protein
VDSERFKPILRWGLPLLACAVPLVLRALAKTT